MAIDIKYGRVTVENEPGNPFGEDEPVFIIRARDKSALRAIDYYGEAAAEAGASIEFLGLVGEVHGFFRHWQATHPDLVKVPD